MQPIVLAITGASGAIYGIRLLEVLLAAGRTVYLSISPSGQAVLLEEIGLNVNLADFSVAAMLRGTASDDGAMKSRVRYCHYQDLMSPIASGSFLTAGMVVCPCSG